MALPILRELFEIMWVAFLDLRFLPVQSRLLNCAHFRFSLEEIQGWIKTFPWGSVHKCHQKETSLESTIYIWMRHKDYLFFWYRFCSFREPFITVLSILSNTNLRFSMISYHQDVSSINTHMISSPAKSHTSVIVVVSGFLSAVCTFDDVIKEGVFYIHTPVNHPPSPPHHIPASIAIPIKYPQLPVTPHHLASYHKLQTIPCANLEPLITSVFL